MPIELNRVFPLLLFPVRTLFGGDAELGSKVFDAEQAAKRVPQQPQKVKRQKEAEVVGLGVVALDIEHCKAVFLQ